MIDDIPQRFDETFLRWFRERTEATWQDYPTKTLDDYMAEEVGGYDWQQGTRWLGGLSEQEIRDAEQRHQVRFPPDYRLFLQMLHSVDRPMAGASFIDDRNMIPTKETKLYNWKTDTEIIRARYEWVVTGLIFDVKHNVLWPESWGAKPDTSEAQEARVRELVNNAPKLIPIFSHRYLLAEPCQAGNPVLSIWQSDIIVYGLNLHDYFLKEFRQLIGLEDDISVAQRIPFWGEFNYKGV